MLSTLSDISCVNGKPGRVRSLLCQLTKSYRPHLAFLAYSPQSSSPVGVIVCKQSTHRNSYNRGYIAMLSVDKAFRKRGIGEYMKSRSSLSSQISYVRMKPRFHLIHCVMGVFFVYFSFGSSQCPCSEFN